MSENRYTPIKDRQTKEPIFLGDFVESEKGYCGILIWDEYLNRYIIQTVQGGNIYARTFIKLVTLHKNRVDTTKVECRSRPNKKRH